MDQQDHPDRHELSLKFAKYLIIFYFISLRGSKSLI
jgi:hypothetical protein